MTGSTEHGYVTTKKGSQIRLFSINRTTVPGKRVVLRCTLPGFSAPAGRAMVSEASARAMAQLMLEKYVEILTGED